MAAVQDLQDRVFRGTLAGALRDFGRSWVLLAKADLIYKALAFVALTPLASLVLRWFVNRSRGAAVADVDIAMFFFTTKPGFTALVLFSALLLAITAMEHACLITIGLGITRGVELRVRDALAHVGARAFAILRVAILLVLRVLLNAAPFLAAIGATYWALLRAHDINYYLTAKPPEFLAAIAIVGVIAAGLVAVLLWRISGWAVTVPIVVFERKLPVLAFGESVRRMKGRRWHAIVALATWVVFSVALSYLVTGLVQITGRTVAPIFAGGSLAGLLGFIGAFALIWGVLSLAANVTTTTLWSMIVLRLYLLSNPPANLSLPKRGDEPIEIGGRRLAVPWGVLAGVLVAGVILTSGLAYFVMRNAWTQRPVLVIAHRGASHDAPENTLAAFRRAADERADLVELDVQESSDGVVVVAHDSDLMKVGSSPLKIWEATADELRQVDIGSYRSAEFKDERVPTLAEALEACRGKSRVNIELKEYGHGQRLAERVVEIVEAAGMQDQIVTMSLSRELVAAMKRLRPEWTSGLLTAKAIGDLSGLAVDFLAVESGMATRRFIRLAHAAGKPVYVWTVNDPQRMIRMIGLGVDGLITDRPEVARDVIRHYAEMSEAQRLFVFVMTRFGVREELSTPEDGQRP
jgi:glycerophosphoryl diester phosphodiesterase